MTKLLSILLFFWIVCPAFAMEQQISLLSQKRQFKNSGIVSKQEENAGLNTIGQDMYAIDHEEIDPLFESANVALASYKKLCDKQRAKLNRSVSIAQDGKHKLVRCAALSKALYEYDQDTAYTMGLFAQCRQGLADSRAKSTATLAQVNLLNAEADVLLAEIQAIRQEIPKGLHLHWLVTKHCAGEAYDWASQHPKTCFAIATGTATACWTAYRFIKGKPFLPDFIDSCFRSMFEKPQIPHIPSPGAPDLAPTNITAITKLSDDELRIAYEAAKKKIKHYVNKGHSLEWCLKHGYIESVELLEWIYVNIFPDFYNLAQSASNC